MLSVFFSNHEFCRSISLVGIWLLAFLFPSSLVDINRHAVTAVYAISNQRRLNKDDQHNEQDILRTCVA